MFAEAPGSRLSPTVDSNLERGTNVLETCDMAHNDLSRFLYPALVATNVNDNPSDQVQADLAFYLRYLFARISPDFHNVFAPLLHSTFLKFSPYKYKYICIVAEIAQILRTNSSASIDDVIEKLTDKLILHRSCIVDNAHRPKARHLIFCLEGWLTMLYMPAEYLATNLEELRIQTLGSKAFGRDTQAFSQSNRPFTEVLNVFGILGDIPRNGAFADALEENMTSPTKPLATSLLDVSILGSIGGLEICWVDCLTSHLTFQSSQKLFVFRLPSFARLHAENGTLLASILGDLSDDHEDGDRKHQDRDKNDEDPDDSSMSCQLLHEVLLSYQLLFASSKAQSLYRAVARKRAIPGGMLKTDPLLDELCGGYDNRFSLRRFLPRRNTIDASVQFPILRQRLMQLQRYIATRPVRGLRALYHDERDSYQWWTFWAVIWIGGAGLVLSFISTVFTGIQTAYAIKSFAKEQ